MWEPRRLTALWASTACYCPLRILTNRAFTSACEGRSSGQTGTGVTPTQRQFMNISVFRIYNECLNLKCWSCRCEWNYVTSVQTWKPPGHCPPLSIGNYTLNTWTVVRVASQLQRSGALTPETAELNVFWHVIPYSLVDVYRTFGGTCCLYPQNR
jgi:hypothetical protein